MRRLAAEVHQSDSWYVRLTLWLYTRGFDVGTEQRCVTLFVQVALSFLNFCLYVSRMGIAAITGLYHAPRERRVLRARFRTAEVWQCRVVVALICAVRRPWGCAVYIVGISLLLLRVSYHPRGAGFFDKSSEFAQTELPLVELSTALLATGAGHVPPITPLAHLSIQVALCGALLLVRAALALCASRTPSWLTTVKRVSSLDSAV